MTTPLAILGATGKTGRLLVDDALARGIPVRALVRGEPPAEWAGRVEVVRGDATDAAALAKLVAGARAVVSALGWRADSHAELFARSVAALIAEMERAGTRRLVVVTGAGVRAPQDRPALPDIAIAGMIRLMRPGLLEDSERQRDLLVASGLDWTLVRSGRMVDGPPKGVVRVGYVGVGTRPMVRRADLAAFILDMLEAGSHVRDMPMVSS